MNEEFKKLCEQVPEIQLYYIINTYGGDIWRLNHDLADGRMPESEEVDKYLAELQEHIQYAVDQTKRFGVETPRGENGVATPTYWSWFRWWDSYTQSLPPDSQDKIFQIFDAIGEVIGGRANHHLDDLAQKLSIYRPTQDWRVVSA